MNTETNKTHSFKEKASKAVKAKRRSIFGEDSALWQMSQILSFVLPVTIILCIFILRSIYPFGSRSFLVSDMYHQYMPFFTEFMEKIKAGEGLSYSYQVGVGSNFLALYVYYLASPLHWLAFLVPQSHLMEFMSYLAVIKMGLCGVTAFHYLEKHFRVKDPGILFFSTFYALSGFLAAYNWNIMWLDCVILLPMIVLGLEKLVKEGNGTFYCIMLALSIFTNFYISIMICMFLVLYFVLLLVTEKCNWRVLGRFALYSLLAGGMASVLLIPEVCAILATDFGDVSFPEKLESYFSVFDMLSRHCICVSTERGLAHWPNIYCGVGAFLFLPMYALEEKIPIRQRFCKLALTGFILLGFATNMLDFIWHGLNYPDSLPGRQSFLYIFLVLTMCYEAYLYQKEPENAGNPVGEKGKKTSLLPIYLGTVVYFVLCEKFIDSEDFELGGKFLSLLFVTFYAVLLYLYQHQSRKRVRVAIGILALTLVAAESGINFYDTSISTVSRTAYLEQLPNYQELYKYAKERESGEFFRLEKFERKTKNDGTLAGYPTASLFSSTMNSTVMDLYERLGMRHSKVYYGFDGATGFTSALLNVKYMFWEDLEESPKDFENSLYTPVKSQGNVDMYACEVTLPFGYVAPKGYDLPKNGSGPYLQNLLVRKLGILEDLFTAAQCKQKGDDVEITASKSGIHYAMITSYGNTKITAKGCEFGALTHKDVKNGSVLYLGYLEAGDVVTLSNEDEEDETLKITAKAYLMNGEVLNSAIESLAENHLENVTYDSTHINGSLSLKEPGRLILSVPYEKGWTVLVNGEMVEPELFGKSFMALDLEAGDYEIALSYVPWGRNAGIVVSLGCLIVFIGMVTGKRWMRNRKTSKN